MRPYHELLERILANGVERGDRTGTGTRAIFGHQMRFALCSDGFVPAATTEGSSLAIACDQFPLITTKKLHLRSIIHELLWFISGDTNVRTLQASGVTIWDEWADPETGELGPIYGRQWRSWPAPDQHDPARTIDQLALVIAQLKASPSSRRHIVTAWNPAVIDQMALPPCHCLFQFFVAPPDPDAADPRPALSCQLYQRSADVFLGVPFNIASYALLTAMVAQVIGARPGEFIHTFGDVHLYMNHFDQARTQLDREPRPSPRLLLDPSVRSIDGFRFEHIGIEGYDPHPAIRAPIAV